MRLTLLCIAGIVLALASAGAQDSKKRPQAPQTVEERIEFLEAEAIYLKSEISALRERLDALLGKSPEDQVYRVSPGESPVRGEALARITLLEFGDYQSDYSTRAAHVVARLLEEFPAELRFVFKHYPLTPIHPQATEAALAALAAEKQERGWEMHDLLFKNSRRLDADLLLTLAQELGMNLTRFDADRRSLWALERLSTDEKEAVRMQVGGVPTFFLNGKRMKSWRYDFLRDQIQDLLTSRTAGKP